VQPDTVIDCMTRCCSYSNHIQSRAGN